MDVERELVAGGLTLIGRTEDRQTRLVAGTAVEIGDVVVADEVALPERDVALAAIHHAVGAGIENAVHESGALAGAGGEHPGMHFAFGLTGANRREYFRKRIIELIGRLLLLRD